MIRRVLAAGLVLALAACTDAAPETTRTPSASGQTYAVLTSGRLLLVTGDTVTFTLDGDFAGGVDSMAWTGDGRYLVLASGADRAERTLSILDGHDGRARTIPCPDCQDPVGLPGSRVVVADSQRGLSIVDAERGELSKIPSQLPFHSLGLRVLDAADDRVLVAGADTDMVAPSGGPEDMYEVRLSGETTPLGSTEANAPVRARLGPDGKLAIVMGFHGGACAQGSAVQVRPGGTWLDPPTVPIREADGLGATLGPYAAYSDVWWAPDGRLHALARAWKCTDRGDTTTVPEDPPVLALALDATGWTILPQAPASHVVVERWRDGTLTVLRDGTPMKIGDDTIAVTLRPA
ncbi:hypothetical protein ACLQ2S_22765 [Micromonospora sp. DT48]|uniref:hypothetical protein n=1 Tax=Micromonospora sp. DT48 TaxID=3393429 RepID=UPI003CFA5645